MLSRLRLCALAPRLVRTLATRSNAGRVFFAQPLSRPIVSPLQSRFFATRLLDNPAKEVKYEDVANLVKSPDPDTIIVDVREPDEYAAGHIPGAVNIPFRSRPGALGLDDAEFKKTFGIDKPSTQKTLLFYCHSGVRSTGAEQIASTYGYLNRANYLGSFEDWLKHEPKAPVTSPVTPPKS